MRMAKPLETEMRMAKPWRRDEDQDDDGGEEDGDEGQDGEDGEEDEDEVRTETMETKMKTKDKMEVTTTMQQKQLSI